MKKLLIILFSFCFFLPLFASARETSQITDWYIKDLHSEYVVNQDSSLTVTEKITADCGNLPGKHGIFRVLPTRIYITGTRKQDTPLTLISITDLSGNPIPYSEKTDRINHTVSWQIGDPNKTVKGENFYQIKYQYQNAIMSNVPDRPDLDELYWDLNGAFWDIETDSFTGVVKFPDGINQANTKINLYSGKYGTKTNQYSESSWLNDNTLEVKSTKVLVPKQAISLSATFPKNILTPYKPTFWESYGAYFWLIIPLLIFLFCLNLWRKYGDDPEINSAVAPEFEIPDKLSPLDMGMLYSNGIFKNQYVSASIINLAVKKYIKIESLPKKGIFGADDYKLHKLKEVGADTSESEKLLLARLFTDGKETLLSSQKNKFYEDAEDIQKESKKFLKDNKYTEDGGNGYAGIFIALAFILGGISIYTFISAYVMLGISLMLSALILIIFTALMAKRTEKGAMMYHRILGFKLYMDTAEKYRQRFNEKENIFEKLLPYAIMFGMTKEWINKMKEIYGEGYFNSYHPVWFYGYAFTSFNVDSLASSIDSMSGSMASTLSSSPSSSGSGGGGFSGGGGGGGGGGGW